MSDNLPESLTAYEKPDWEALEKADYSVQRAAITKLTRHSGDAKMFIEGCMREICEGARNAAVLQTIHHAEQLLGPLTEELVDAAKLIPKLKEAEDGDPVKNLSRRSRAVTQFGKASDGVFKILDRLRELSPDIKAGTYIDKQLNYADLRGGVGTDRAVPADIIAEADSI